MKGSLVDFGLSQSTSVWEQRMIDLTMLRQRGKKRLKCDNKSGSSNSNTSREVGPKTTSSPILLPASVSGHVGDDVVDDDGITTTTTTTTTTTSAIASQQASHEVNISNLSTMRPDRAGTPGFRPLEVLMSSWEQTTSIDIWAAGIIFLSLLSKRYPFFPTCTSEERSDEASLLQIVNLIGPQKVKDCAQSLHKSIELPSEEMLGYDANITFSDLIDESYKYRDIASSSSSSPSSSTTSTSSTTTTTTTTTTTGVRRRTTLFHDHAVQLLSKMLEGVPKLRSSASDALEMGFFSQQ
jgi:serine/threonine protein kinase